MDFILSTEELALLYGLSHIQQLAYLRGIRPYMDFKTGLVGIKRRISYQSISEQLYVEPYQGIKGQSFSRDQVRRAVAGLVRVGIIELQSEGLQLILKCQLAPRSFSVQNKAAINPPQKATINPHNKSLVDPGFSQDGVSKADIVESPKAATPLIKDNYIYLLSQFEKFWLFYPEKKSRQLAWKAFELLNPDNALFNKMLEALQAQLKNHEAKQANGIWSPPWKYPANWLAQRCWEDEVTLDKTQENKRAAHRKNTGSESTKDMFWTPDEPDDERAENNVIPFKQFQ